MILRPVTPASADGPPWMKLPVGFTNSVRLLFHQVPSAFGPSSSRTYSVILFWSASGVCCVETTTAVTSFGSLPS